MTLFTKTTVTPRPLLRRDVTKEPLAYSQQLRNVADGVKITEVQKAQLCAQAYEMEHGNLRADAVRMAVCKNLAEYDR